ncbi:Tad domain-containing protein [Erythrobacter sp.]|uniref:Tad domain-containing protein n=1 Tax=Erythrobacter sp. TaxID=1042 RepID=UPI001425F480|nr:Tad domain-containing protein [Erythrobacter sp.]QIQ86053.1 MAG: VWA domain-containing protein [Erythrobacter sp.]
MGRYQTGPDPDRKSLLRALVSDETANTIVISAMALFPLMAMVGGGVDASRYYMAQSRLQAACDAGALAARRAMADDTFNQEHKTIGLNFFDQNYTDGTFGLENRQRDYTASPDGEVNGIASGTLPTTIMSAFGYEKFDITVECTADINISNTDIVFVVDVTGSMNCAPDNPGGGSCGNTPDPGSKIEGLRDAVMTFYDTVVDSTSPAAQVRYGMVPYASNVNVGAELMAANPAWLAQSHTYQSREANVDTVIEWIEIATNVTNVVPEGDEEYLGVSRSWQRTYSSSACSGLEPDDLFNLIRTDLGTHQGVISQTVDGTIRTTSYRDDNETIWNAYAYSNYYSGSGWCEYGWQVYEDRADVFFDIVEEYREEDVFQSWTYKPVTFDLTTLYDDNRIELPIGNNGSMASVDWDGCIEEADTVAATSFNPVPAGANDLDVNLVPDDPTEYWKPVLRNATWKREDGGNVLGELTQTWDENRPGYSCPAPAFRLRDITRTELQSYVDALDARSSTYHDIGMIWGARFISPNGIFSADNATAPNGDAISRHIVFMTDGILSPSTELYTTYGIEWWDRRVTDNGSNNQARSRHAERFQAACRAARNQNISVWVVAFGTTLTQNLIDCATPGRAFTADDSAQLRDRFEEIAQRIAALRLTQ